MGKINDSLRRRLLKIAELAARGVDGEQQAAESMLARLLKKHSLSLDDLSKHHERSWAEFAVDGRYELQLLEQVIRRVTQKNEFDRCRSQQDLGTAWYELTPGEHVEVQLLFDVLKVHMHDQLEKTVAAFVLKNEIYGPIVDALGEVLRTPAEQARSEQIALLAQDMALVPILPALG